MRINQQIPPADNTTTDRISGSVQGQTQSTPAQVPSQPNDTVQLSSTQGTVRQLAAHVDQVPDVRQQKVDALRAQVQSGSYQPSNQSAAGAIVNELFGPG